MPIVPIRVEPCACGYHPHDSTADDPDNAHTGTSESSCPISKALKNHVTFPSFCGLPSIDEPSEIYLQELEVGKLTPVKHWCFIGDVLSVDEPFLRSKTTVRTRFNETAAIGWYLDRGELPRGLVTGNTLCILYAQRKIFMDGSIGIRHDSVLDYSFVFSCSFEELQSEANHLLRNFQEDSWHCFVCEKKTKSNCGKCKLASYCSVDCQKGNWQAHKKTCPDEAKLLGLAILPYAPYDGQQLTFSLLAELALEMNNQVKARAVKV